MGVFIEWKSTNPTILFSPVSEELIVKHLLAHNSSYNLMEEEETVERTTCTNFL